jgi:hypothetical protein
MLARIRIAVLFLFAAGFAAVPAASSRADSHSRSEKSVTARLAEIESRLDGIASATIYAPLFGSGHKDIARMERLFTFVQKAVHEAGKEVQGGAPISTEHADLFHGALREFMMNIEEMESSAAFGETTTPDKRDKEKLLKELASIRTLANTLRGFEQASFTEPSFKAEPSDAVLFAKRSLMEVYWLLDNRTMTNVTSQGISAGKDLREALDAVWVIVEETLDADGELVIRTDDSGKPLRDQLAPFKEAMEEARTQAEFYRKIYKPNVRRDAHRRRAEGIEALLSEKAFERGFLAVKSLRSAAPTPKKP